MAVATASPTKPGLDCQVPKPKDGILAPVFNSKKRMSFAIFKFQRAGRRRKSERVIKLELNLERRVKRGQGKCSRTV